MNFLIRTAQPVVPEVSTVVEPEHQMAVIPIPKPAATLEGLIAEETFSSHSIGNDAVTDSEQVGFVAFDPEDFDRFSSEKLIKSKDTGNERLLSFRGVSLEPERFSTHCGLDGIYLPGRRWRRKLEIIQPLEIRSFAAECNTEDLVCVQIKVLTLKATNLTTEDLTFTVLAPEIPTSPSVLSLSSTPRTPMNSYAAFHDYAGSSVPIATKSQKESSDDGKTSSSIERTAMMSDVILSNSTGFTHLWLQSAVPLG
ncbi:hypothetical protein B296_00005338 [Ensete ventricosum]|uniref:Uncharacterized protein n=1 Tax=Ensete ventricosum TaxID=4639 RepID=A0A427B1B2_ENSVE|nr:hypothetical protein B296_00005338 [Ensete ventricosum]